MPWANFMNASVAFEKLCPCLQIRTDPSSSFGSSGRNFIWSKLASCLRQITAPYRSLATMAAL